MAVLSLCFYSVSQAQFTISAEIRPRLEVNHGVQNLFNSPDKTAVIFSQRSRLTTQYDHKIFTIKLSVQDVRVWGEEKQLGDVAGVSLHEAWGEVNANEFISFRIGRQELIYDDHRLLGSVNWLQQARSHDAVVAKLEKKSWKFHVGGAYNNDSYSLTKAPYTMGAYRALQFVWVNKSFDKGKISLIGIANGVEDGSGKLHFTGTVGPHATFATDNVSGFATFYYQFGQLSSGTEVSAFLAAVNANYKVKKTKIGVGFDYLSGNDALNASQTKMRTFNTLYATNHKFYGFMDYFLNIPVHTAGGGLMDVYAKVSAKVGDKASLMFAGHYFMLAGQISDDGTVTGDAIDRGLGAEIDAVFNYNIHKWVNFKLGWNVLIPTESLAAIDSGTKGKFNTGVWTMITFKPIMFKSKEKEDLLGS